MPAARPAPKPIPPQNRTRVGNGSSLFTEKINQQSTPARRYREILAQILADIGGDPTELQMQIARRAVSLSLWAESIEARLVSGDEVDIATFATVANALRRLLGDLGIGRRAIDITQPLDRYLASQRLGPTTTDDVTEDETAEREAAEQVATFFPVDETAP